MAFSRSAAAERRYNPVEFFETVDGRITEVSEFTEGCWVNMVHPSSDELEQIRGRRLRLRKSLFATGTSTPEEGSRVDTEDEQLLMIVDIPMVEKSSVEETAGRCSPPFRMGIVVAQNAVITVCLEDSIILRSIAEGAVKGVHTSLKTRFVLPDSAPHRGSVSEKPAYDRARLYPHREASVRLAQK